MPFDELLPCPFCGGGAAIIEREGRMYDVGCGSHDCYLTAGADWYLIKSEAVRLWNHRAG